MPAKKIVIIAGPNGAGKTTFAREFLPNEAECLFFINADLIEAGLSPFEPERAAIKAGKLMLESIALMRVWIIFISTIKAVWIFGYISKIRIVCLN